ncbi:hypothetical protein KC949_01335, partial [Candidatus Saccharibacteria bacterium]|nr:hypothetical protein [Candidatus Saccharibacteria bacterium]
MSIEKPLHYPQEQNENLDENEVQEGYNETDLEGIDTAAATAQDLVSNAIENGHTNHEVVETDAGLRGRVHNTFPGGNLEALFANATLERVNLELHNGEQKVQLSILDPESSAPRLMLDGKAVSSEEIPGVQKVMDALRAAHAEKPAETVPQEDAEPSEQVATPEQTSADVVDINRGSEKLDRTQIPVTEISSQQAINIRHYQQAKNARNEAYKKALEQQRRAA